VLANSRRARGLSAQNSQQYQACFTSRPPVFTRRYCKLVKDQFSILFGTLRATVKTHHDWPLLKFETYITLCAGSPWVEVISRVLTKIPPAPDALGADGRFPAEIKQGYWLTFAPGFAPTSVIRDFPLGIEPTQRPYFKARTFVDLVGPDAGLLVVDAQEDGKYGNGKRGDELPKELARRESRLEKIWEARAALEHEAREAAGKKHAEVVGQLKEREKQERERGRKLGGGWPSQAPDPQQAKPERKAQRSFTDPDSQWQGIDLFVAPDRQKHGAKRPATTGPSPPQASVAEQMRHKLRTAAG
jgi:hypothetical protein